MLCYVTQNNKFVFRRVHVENIVGKGEILKTSFFFFSIIILFTLSQVTNFRLFQTPSNLKEFEDDNFNCDENGRKLSKRLENIVGKKNEFSFSLSDFKRL